MAIFVHIFNKAYSYFNLSWANNAGLKVREKQIFLSDSKTRATGITLLVWESFLVM